MEEAAARNSGTAAPFISPQCAEASLGRHRSLAPAPSHSAAAPGCPGADRPAPAPSSGGNKAATSRAEGGTHLVSERRLLWSCSSQRAARGEAAFQAEGNGMWGPPVSAARRPIAEEHPLRPPNTHNTTTALQRYAIIAHAQRTATADRKRTTHWVQGDKNTTTLCGDRTGGPRRTRLVQQTARDPRFARNSPVGREADFSEHTRTHSPLLWLLLGRAPRRKRGRHRRQAGVRTGGCSSGRAGFTQTAAHRRFGSRQRSSSSALL